MILADLERRVQRWVEESRPFLAMFGAFAGLLDAAVEGVYEARKAALPGQVDLPGVEGLGGFDVVDALPYIGRDRGIAQGPAELPWDYAAELRGWRESKARAGTPAEILSQLAAVLGPDLSTPLRIFDLHGNWWTRDSDGTISWINADGAGLTFGTDGSITPDATVAPIPDWDSVTDPPTGDQGDVTRWFVVIYPPAAGPYLTDTDHTFLDPGLVDDGWDNLTVSTYADSPDAGTVGTNANIQLVETVRGALNAWGTPGNNPAYVIVSFDITAFDPTQASPVYPDDGTWGHHTKYDAGTNSRIIARFEDAEYWPGAPGGEAP